jgi:quinol monooxygenase YgiN
MPTPYINAVELDIVPAEYEKFKAAILENAAASMKEPGCRQFDVPFEDGDAPTACVRSMSNVTSVAIE